jgi:hypothetical protein
MTMPTAICGLFAAGPDWLEALLPVLFVGFWIVSQVIAAVRRGQPGGPQRPPRVEPGRLPAPPRGPADDAVDLRGELERQIADFLRDSSSESRRGPQRSAGPAKALPEPRGPVVPGAASGTVKTRRREEPGAGAPKTDVGAGRSGPPALGADFGTLKNRRRDQADTAVAGRLDERAPRDEAVARHVSEAFSHELAHLRGDLATAAPQPAAAPATQAQELVRLLRQPATVRQLILLGAVLDRPVDRW